MKKFNKSRFLLLVLILTFASSAQAIELKFGSESHMLSVKLEHEVDEPYGKPLPLGPSSVRFFNNSLWVSDSLAGRLVEYDNYGKFKRAITIDSPDVFPGDFCPADKDNSAFWVIDIDSSTLLKIDQTGKVTNKVATIDGRQLQMPVQIEVLSNGNLLLLDAGIGELLEFDSTMTLVWATEIFGERIALDDKRIYYLNENDEEIILTRKQVSDGSTKSLATGFSAESYPALQAVDTDGNAVISFVVFDENENEDPAFYLTLAAADDSLSLGINFPPHFLVRSLISDPENHFYIISFDENGLTLHKTLLSFNLEGSDG